MPAIKNPQNYISIRGAGVHNLKNIDLDIPKNKLVVILVFLARANPVWLLILCMPKAKEDMWKACRLTHGSFWV